MQVIAFDLSLSNSGYAVGIVEDRKLTVDKFGSIGTKRFSKRSTGFRLNVIAQELRELYKQYPNAQKVVKEQSFSNARIKATQQIFKVNGVFELISYLAGHEDFAELTPSTVKKQLTDDGRADKDAVAIAVQELTGVSSKVNDETDAVAVLYAYCKKEGLID